MGSGLTDQANRKSRAIRENQDASETHTQLRETASVKAVASAAT